MTAAVTAGPLRTLLTPFLIHAPAIAAAGALVGLLESIGLGFILPLVALLTGDAMPPGLPLPLSRFVTALAGLSPVERIALSGGAIAGLIAVKGVVQVLNETYLARIQGRIDRSLRDAVVTKLTRVEYRQLLIGERGRLMRLLSSDPATISLVCLEAAHLLAAGSTLAILAGALLLLDWRLFLAVAVSVSAIRAILHALQARVRLSGDAYSLAEEQLHARDLALFAGLKAVRLFGRHDDEATRHASAAAGLDAANVAIRQKMAATHPALEVLFAVLLVGVVVFARARGMHFAELSVFLVLLYRTQTPLKAISASLLTIASRRAAIADLDAFLQLEDERDPAEPLPLPTPDWPAIHFRAVGYRYPNGHAALSHADFTLEPGTNTALIGPSGAGKSTLVNLLCRLLVPSEGQILLGDAPIDRFAHEPYRAGIALAGQDIELIDGTVAENIAYGRPEASEAQIVDAARMAEADGFIRALPQGYATPVGPGGSDLSGGQRQRIGVARAVLRRPRLLILDEATSAVDGQTEAGILRVLADRTLYGAALVISHRPATLALCNAAVVIRDGEVVEAGPLAQCTYFAEMNAAPDAAAGRIRDEAGHAG